MLVLVLHEAAKGNTGSSASSLRREWRHTLASLLGRRVLVLPGLLSLMQPLVMASLLQRAAVREKTKYEAGHHVTNENAANELLHLQGS